MANAHSNDDNAIICNLRDFELEHCKYDPTHDTWVNKSSANNLHCGFFATHNPCDSSALGLQTPLAEHCTPDRWTCHSVRASPPWTTCSPRHSCSSAGTNVFDKVAGGVVNSAIVLAAARGIQKSTANRQLNELGRGWSKSVMEHMGFVVT